VYRNYAILVIYCIEVLSEKLFEPYSADTSPEWYQTYKSYEKLCLPVAVDGEVHGFTMALYSCHCISSQGRRFTNDEISK